MRGEETRREILEQPALMRRALSLLSVPARYAAEAVAVREFVYSIGVGPALHPASLLGRILGKVGGPGAIEMDAEDFSNWLAEKPKRPAAVIFSETGEEREALLAIRELRKRDPTAPVVSVLGSPGSTLHRASDYSLVFTRGPGRMGLFSPMSVAGLLLATEVARLAGMPARAHSLRSLLEVAPEQAAEALGRVESSADEAAEMISRSRLLFVVSTNGMKPAAQEFSYRLTLMSGIMCDVSSPGEFLATKHRLLSVGTPVLVLEPERNPEVKVAAERYGATVIGVGPAGPHVPLGVNPPGEIAPLVYAPALLLLALKVTLSLGIDPDESVRVM